MNYPKYDTLPDIMSSRSGPDLFTPRNNPGKYQPITALSYPGYNTASDAIALPTRQVAGFAQDDSANRVKTLEMRLVAAENSNRALLEEVVRLQNEMKMGFRRYEENLKFDQGDKVKVGDNLRLARDAIAQLATRLQSTEQKLETGQSSVSNLASQVKRLEQNLVTAQRDVLQKNDTYFNRLSSVQSKVEETSEEKNKLSQIVSSLYQEMRSIKQQLEVKALEYNTLSQEIQKRNAQIENETHGLVEHFRKTQDIQSGTDYQQQVLKSNVESRLSEIRDALIDLRSRTVKEEADRRQSEQALNKRCSEQQTLISEQSRVIEDLRHEISKLASATTSALEREKAAANDRVLRSEDDMKKSMQMLEQKIKHELSERMAEVEKITNSEKEHRYATERAVRQETNSALEEMNKKIMEELAKSRKTHKTDKSKNTENLRALNESLTLMDRQYHEMNDKLSKTLKAEIASRETQDKALSHSVEEVNHKLGIAVTTLRQVITPLQDDLKTLRSEYARELENVRESFNLSANRAIADLDARVSNMQHKLKDNNIEYEIKLQENAERSAEKSAEVVKQVSVWHEQVLGRVSEIHENYNKMNPQLTDLQSQLANFRMEANSRADIEQATRIREIQDLRADMASKLAAKASQSQLEKLQESTNEMRDDIDLSLAEAKRLRDSLEQFHAQYDRRFQDETTTRTEQITGLRENLNRLRNLVDRSNRPNSNPPSPRRDPPPARDDPPARASPTPPTERPDTESGRDEDRWADNSAAPAQPEAQT